MDQIVALRIQPIKAPASGTYFDLELPPMPVERAAMDFTHTLDSISRLNHPAHYSVRILNDVGMQFPDEALSEFIESLPLHTLEQTVAHLDPASQVGRLAKKALCSP